MTAALRTVCGGHRCTCHHPGRRCFYQCPETATAIRLSDGRPVCGFCVDHSPEDSAGFNVPSCCVGVLA